MRAEVWLRGDWRLTSRVRGTVNLAHEGWVVVTDVERRVWGTTDQVEWTPVEVGELWVPRENVVGMELG